MLLLGRLRPLLRWRYLILALVTLVIAVRWHNSPIKNDWPDFMWGSRLLFGDHPTWAREPGGLHLFANYEAQIGPLTLVLTALLRALWGPVGSHNAAIILMTPAGLLAVYLLERSAAALHGEHAEAAEFRQLTVLLGGLVFMIAWTDLTAWFVHVDDALALLLACGAIWAVATQRPITAGALIGLAVAAKPWAIVAAPLTLVFGRRHRGRAVGGLALVLCLTWLPFIVADPGTLSAGAPVAPTSPRSILHLVGFDVGSTPTGIRAVQLVAAVTLGLFALWRKRWPAALLVGVVVRVLLDPGVYDYYMTGVLVAAFAWELLRTDRPLPLVTMGLSWVLFIPTITLHYETLEAVLRLVVGVVTIGIALFSTSRPKEPVIVPELTRRSP